MDLLAGRDFNAHDTPQSPKVAVINETMAKKYFAGRSPIGKRYRAEEPSQWALGLKSWAWSKTRNTSRCARDILPTTFLAASQDATPMWYQFELRAAGSPTALISGAKSAIAEVNRDVSLQFKTLALQGG